MTGQQQRAAEGGWLRRDEDPTVDDAGSVLLAWRTAAGRTQTEVAGVLGTTQQHLSQIETGQRPVSLELRRKMVTELGIAAEDLGLSSGPARRLVSSDDASPQIAASRLRWRDERRWLNQHRAELGALAVQLYPAEYRLPPTAAQRKSCASKGDRRPTRLGPPSERGRRYSPGSQTSVYLPLTSFFAALAQSSAEHLSVHPETKIMNIATVVAICPGGTITPQGGWS